MFSMVLKGQVFKNSRATLTGITKDSQIITANTQEAIVVLDLQTAELILKVQLSDFAKTNTFEELKKLKLHNEKLYFKGNLGIDPIKLINEQNTDKPYTITGYIKLNGEKHAVSGTYSVFQQNNTTESNRKILLTLFIPFLLSDFNLAQDMDKFKDEVTISIIKQPINLQMESH
jgi:hypothetical protein